MGGSDAEVENKLIQPNLQEATSSSQEGGSESQRFTWGNYSKLPKPSWSRL